MPRYQPQAGLERNRCRRAGCQGCDPAVGNSRFGEQHRVNAKDEMVGEIDSMLAMPLSLDMDSLVAEIQNRDGAAVAAHIDRGFSIIAQLGFIPPDTTLDAVEVRDVSKIPGFLSQIPERLKARVLSSSDAHYLDMMKPPKMKLWLEELTVAGCLACLKGDGPGKLSVQAPKKRPHPSGVDGRKSGWKGLYGH